MVKKCVECCNFKTYENENLGYPYGQAGKCSFSGHEVYGNTIACSYGFPKDTTGSKGYRIMATMYGYVNVTAKSETEAYELAEKMNANDFDWYEKDFDLEIVDTFELEE